ncbi:HdeD family acid-resistance protein [Aquipuribacter sp. SD81]|uniref:HdeD family acid-resistance protein n=1 Tax=Aquipuribacter sp. SD81 TaxID=3127703 RepID=UPI003015E671
MSVSSPALGRRRTPWDVVLGVLVALAGLVVLGNAVLATAFSVLLVGWSALLTGLVLVVAAFVRIRRGGFWSTALGGALLAVLGAFVLANPLVTAVSLTLTAGALFLASGITRIAVAVGRPEGRAVLVVSGVASTLLGAMVLVNLFTASLSLLGILVGVQAVIEGVTMVLLGRVRVIELPTSGPVGVPAPAGAPQEESRRPTGAAPSA